MLNDNFELAQLVFCLGALAYGALLCLEQSELFQALTGGSEERPEANPASPTPREENDHVST
jgi:hypothetical protein